MQITSISYILPDGFKTNEDLQNTFENSLNDFTLKKLGIEKRHHTPLNQSSAGLSIKAIYKLIEEHSIDIHSMEAIVYVSPHQDYITPTNSNIIHGEFKLKESVAVYDFVSGCSAFIFGLSIVKALINTFDYKKVLIVTSSTLTKYIYEKDKANLMVFGDAACATLVEKGSENNFEKFILKANGSKHENIIIRDGLDKNKINPDSTIERQDKYGNIYTDKCFYMNGESVFLFTIREIPKLITEILTANNLSKDEIDLFIFHQANGLILDKLKSIINIPEEKFYCYYQNVGNTVANSIPIALYHAIKDGRAKKGDKILLAGFGTGLSWGGTVLVL